MSTRSPKTLPTVSPVRLHGNSRSRAAVAQSPLYAGRLYLRRAVDVRAQLLAQCRLDGQSFDVVVHGRTVDLSRSGAGVTLTRDLPAGLEVVLNMQLPGSDGPLCLQAVVVRRAGFRAGLKFLQLTPEQRLLLCRFCYS